MTIGELIQAARKNAGLTQEQLAKKCGVATITIRQYESNKREPRLSALQRIADALNVSADQLLPEPTAEQRLAFEGLIRDVGMPRNREATLSVNEMYRVINGVKKIYGEKIAYLVCLMSFMSEIGIDKVVEFAKSIFQYNLADFVPREGDTPEPPPESP